MSSQLLALLQVVTKKREFCIANENEYGSKKIYNQSIIII
jgi:hypothetical protein